MVVLEIFNFFEKGWIKCVQLHNKTAYITISLVIIALHGQTRADFQCTPQNWPNGGDGIVYSPNSCDKDVATLRTLIGPGRKTSFGCTTAGELTGAYHQCSDDDDCDAKLNIDSLDLAVGHGSHFDGDYYAMYNVITLGGCPSEIQYLNDFLHQPLLYGCDQGNCVVTIDGLRTNLTTCEASCVKPTTTGPHTHGNTHGKIKTWTRDRIITVVASTCGGLVVLMIAGITLWKFRFSKGTPSVYEDDDLMIRNY